MSRHWQRRWQIRRWRILSFLILSGLMLSTGCGTPTTKPSSSSIDRKDVVERASEKGPVKLLVRVSPREPRLSDIVEMEVSVMAPPEIEIKSPAFGQAVGDFLVRDYSERADPKSILSSDGLKVRRFVYKLEPVFAGRHLIRSMAIEFIDHRPLSEQKGIASLIESDPFDVIVTSELGDQVPNLADLEPMLAPRPLAGSSFWLWILLPIAILIVAAFVFLRRRKQRVSSIEPRRLSPEEIAHAAFAALLAEGLTAKGQFKEFYLRLTGIVRNFIEGTTGLRAPEQTTEEFLRAMYSRELFSMERAYRLKEFLEAADMIKYAGQQPDQNQVELSIARAREFVDYRTPDDINTNGPMSEAVDSGKGDRQ